MMMNRIGSAVVVVVFFAVVFTLPTFLLAGDEVSPLYGARLSATLIEWEMGLGPLPDDGGEETPWFPVSAQPLSFCAGSVCFGSMCFGSMCVSSDCVGSGCLSSGCTGSLCAGSTCLGSVCAGSVCLGSACVGSTCGGSTTCLRSCDPTFPIDDGGPSARPGQLDCLQP
ncbi:MAG: hypothetical protein WAW06_01535 [bacterium]